MFIIILIKSKNREQIIQKWYVKYTLGTNVISVRAEADNRGLIEDYKNDNIETDLKG